MGRGRGVAGGSVDAVDDQGAGRRCGVTDLQRSGERVTRRLELARVVGVQLEDHLAPADLVAGSDVPGDPGARGDRILLAGTPGPQQPGRLADGPRLEPRDVAVGV